MTLSPGTKLGPYEIVAPLGTGGMGEVRLAKDTNLDCEVALEVSSSGLGMISKAVIPLRREAKATAKLHHANIVPIHATGEEDATHRDATAIPRRKLRTGWTLSGPLKKGSGSPWRPYDANNAYGALPCWLLQQAANQIATADRR